MDVSVAVMAEDIIKSMRFLDGRTWSANCSALQSENMTPAAMANIKPYQHDTIRHWKQVTRTFSNRIGLRGRGANNNIGVDFRILFIII